MKNFILFLFAVAIAVSCKDDDKDADVRDQATGTYEYSSQLYILEGSDLNFVGGDFTPKGTAVLTKNDQGFELKDGADIVFTGSKIAKSANGFAFDVNSQVLIVSETEFEAVGFEKVAVGATNYHGEYESSSKELRAYYKFEGLYYQDEGEPEEVTFVLEIVGTL
jgi:hypothetical protein